MSGKTWFKLRMGYTICLMVATLFIPYPDEIYETFLEENQLFGPWMVFGFFVISILILPFFIVLVVGMQAINTLNKKPWTKPTLESNPFRFGDPLSFFHFAAFLTLGCGAALMITGIWRHWFVIAHGFMIVLGAGAILLGIRLSVRVYAHKFEPTDVPEGHTKKSDENG